MGRQAYETLTFLGSRSSGSAPTFAALKHAACCSPDPPHFSPPETIVTLHRRRNLRKRCIHGRGRGPPGGTVSDYC